MALLLEQEARIGDVTCMKVPSRIVHLPMAFEEQRHAGSPSVRYADNVRATGAAAEQRRSGVQRINGPSIRKAVMEILS